MDHPRKRDSYDEWRTKMDGSKKEGEERGKGRLMGKNSKTEGPF